ncbi:alpha/beta fold hydrolase BchO [Pelagibius sp.]|uniref:alpha/beta fold hydrolase BchO n=1 Tax=Pelagibius sp. TaxID=1931238 RepID=UPI0026261E32|nr:alpha/beta fold hydrolase BchO [Pelagibius sp.]
MSAWPLWEEDGRDWPNRDSSQFVLAGGLEWHVQCAGAGPCLLLLHGTGAATHSWRDLLPLLAQRFSVVAPDLPGHGFSQTAAFRRMSLGAMARSIEDLLATLEVSPALVAGHSAGAAILARMCLDQRIDAKGLISLNGAFLALRGLPGRFFSPIARALSLSAAVPRLFAQRASDPSLVNRLLRETGSRIDAEGAQLYRRLARKPAHVSAALDMMANWNLDRLEAELPRLPVPLLLIVGTRDRSVSPAQARRIKAMVPAAELVSMPGLGHLAHEEEPQQTADLIARFARDVEALPA